MCQVAIPDIINSIVLVISSIRCQLSYLNVNSRKPIFTSFLNMISNLLNSYDNIGLGLR
jgi:hypothetical protein